MPTHSRFLEPEAVVETVYAGTVTPGELGDALRATANLCARRGTANVLADCSALTDGHTVTDLYGVVASLDAAALPRALREAIVLPVVARMADEARFYETAARNRGWAVRVFADRESALAWLGGDEA